MAGTPDFIRLSGIVILGILAIFIGIMVMILLAPYLIAGGYTAVVSTLLFMFIWLVVYIGLVGGAIIVYFFTKPEPRSQAKAPAKPLAKAKVKKGKK